MDDNILPLRAEEIKCEMLERLLYHLKHVTAITSLLKEAKILEIPAPKGIGKTLNVFGAFNMMIKWDPEIIPVSMGFNPVDGRIKIHDLKCYMSDEYLAKRDYLLSLSPKELVKEADVISFDNIHYVCDLVRERIVSPDVMDMIAKAILDEIDEGKKIILPTESELRHYINLANEDGEFVELVKFIEKDKYFQRMYMFPPSVDELCRIYNVWLSEEVKIIWNKFSDNLPRSFVNMINLFGREITMERVIRTIFQKILKDYLTNDNKLDSASRYEHEIHSKFIYDIYYRYVGYIGDVFEEILGCLPDEIIGIYDIYSHIEDINDLLKRIEILNNEKSLLERKKSTLEKLENNYLKEAKTLLSLLDNYSWKPTRIKRDTRKLKRILLELEKLKEKSEEVKEYIKILYKLETINVEIYLLSHAYEVLKSELFKDLKGEQLRKAIRNLYNICFEHRLPDIVLSIFIENINVGSYYLDLARTIGVENIDVQGRNLNSEDLY